MNTEQDKPKRFEQKLLMRPRIEELPQKFQEIIAELKVKIEHDPEFTDLNFAPSEHPVIVGFYIQRIQGEYGSHVLPVYKTDTGLFAVQYLSLKARYSGTLWRFQVKENEIYS